MGCGNSQSVKKHDQTKHIEVEEKERERVVPPKPASTSTQGLLLPEDAVVCPDTTENCELSNTGQKYLLSSLLSDESDDADFIRMQYNRKNQGSLCLDPLSNSRSTRTSDGSVTSIRSKKRRAKNRSVSRTPQLDNGCVLQPVKRNFSNANESLATYEDSEAETEISVDSPKGKIRKLPNRAEMVDDDKLLIEEAISVKAVHLDLDHCSLIEAPALLENASDWLESLILSHNEIEVLPSFFCSFSALVSLTVAHNCITELPDHIGRIETLERIDVSHNRLSSLPPSFSNLSNVTVCNLDYNAFVHFPCEVLEIPLAIDNVPELMTVFKHGYEGRLPQGLMQWNKIYPDMVLDYLYLGSLRSAQTPKVYQVLGIRHVVTCGKNMQINQENVTRLEVCVEDVEEQSLRPYFDEVFEFVESKKAFGAILVHCFAGLSRSVTMVLAYLMRARGTRLDTAMEQLLKIRPNIHPNKAFMKELLLYDTFLFPNERPLDMKDLGDERTLKRMAQATK